MAQPVLPFCLDWKWRETKAEEFRRRPGPFLPISQTPKTPALERLCREYWAKDLSAFFQGGAPPPREKTGRAPVFL